MEEEMSYKAAILAVLLIGVLCFNASAGCGRWVVRDNTDYLQDPLMDVNDPATDAPNLPDMQGNFAKADGTNQNDTIRANAKPKLKLDLSGKWYVKLNGTANTTSDLILVQSTDLSEDGKDRIQGYGNLKADSLTIPLTGTGLLSNDTLDMGLKLESGSGASKSIEKYVLRLSMVENTLSGSYELYNSDVLTGKGNATATRFGSVGT
jgi:hypothetical protein